MQRLQLLQHVAHCTVRDHCQRLQRPGDVQIFVEHPRGLAVPLAHRHRLDARTRPRGHELAGAHEKAAAATAPKAPEMTRKEREQLEAQKAPEVSKEVDEANRAKLEEIKKRRADQAAKRIAADGWDRFAPVTETNKPPAGYKPPPEPTD